MHDEVTMSVAHGGEYIQEKPNALLDIDLKPGAVDVDLFPSHILEKVGLFIIRHSGIEAPCDMGRSRVASSLPSIRKRCSPAC
jgi:hypothetical protein